MESIQKDGCVGLICGAGSQQVAHENPDLEIILNPGNKPHSLSWLKIFQAASALVTPGSCFLTAYSLAKIQ
jgi:hypothetical protein